MTDTTVKPYPTEPAEVAAAVLDAIENAPYAFNMSTWFSSDSGGVLTPAESPAPCGTTMCVAGWAAHLTGWTLHSARAEKDGHVAYIEDVATEALGLDGDTNEIFWMPAAQALHELRAIAGR